MTRKTAVGGLVSALAVVGVAHAAVPALNSVGHENRHPKATFSAPRADSVTIYLATRPDRATDGSFLSENVEASDFLTDSEIQSGVWLYERQVDPGRYFVMLQASAHASCSSYPPPDYDRVVDPACAEGYSNLLTLTVPKPAQTFRVRVLQYRYISAIELTLRVSPLGENLAYRVCWRLRTKRTRCARSTVDGYDWNDAASDTVTISKRLLPRRTTFAWYVDGKRVATKSVRVLRG